MRPIKTRTTPAMDTTPASTDTLKAAQHGPRNVLVNFLVSREEKEAMQAEAQRRGLSLSGLIRLAFSFFKERV